MFQPKRTDDLQNGAASFIGKTTTWLYGWVIEAEDNDEYAGEIAWCPRGKGWTFGWSPGCDIEWEDEMNEGTQRQTLLGRLEAGYDKLVKLGVVTEAHAAKMIERYHDVDPITLESMVAYVENRIARKEQANGSKNQESRGVS